MSKEKKLSKDVLSRWLDNLRDFAIRMLEEHPAKEDEPWSKGDDEAVEQIKSRIESSAQAKEEPSKEWIDKKTDELFYHTDELFKWEQCREFVCNLFKEVPIKEPSEAELEEFVEKKVTQFCKESYPFFKRPILRKMFKKTLKEYDKLRRG